MERSYPAFIALVLSMGAAMASLQQPTIAGDEASSPQYFEPAEATAPHPPIETPKRELSSAGSAGGTLLQTSAPPRRLPNVGSLTRSARPSGQKAGYSPDQGWYTIMEEAFEGTFPSPGWQMVGSSEQVMWGKRDCRPASGSYSLWSHGGGPVGSATECGSSYPNNLEAYAVYGPFSLEDATSAELELSYWARTEVDADYMLILLSTNAEDWNGWSLSGDSQGWTRDGLDLREADVPGGVLGQPEVWLALGLETDASFGDEGVYFDDLSLRATSSTAPTPTAPASRTASPIPSETPASGEWVTVLGESFETSFPPDGWSLDSTDDAVLWGKRDCRAASGQYSAWAHGGGAVGSTYSCGTLYPGDLETWLIYGPLSFSDVIAAELRFSVWAIIQENEDPFRFMVSVDQETYHGWVLNRSTVGWYTDSFDLAEAAVPGGVLGKPEVWLGFIFESDSGINFEGVHLDDVELRVRRGSRPHTNFLPFLTRRPVTSGRE